MLIWTLAMCLWLHTNTAQNSYGREEPAYPGWEEDGLGLAEDISLTPLSKDSAPFLNLTVQAGATATLTCAFNEITEKTTVSWLRRQEGQLRLLSVGLEIYSRDSRYTFQRSEDNYWQLTVAGVQETDQGLYECQVTSHPPLAYSRYLHVTVPELKILDERGLRILSKFYNAGSTLELKCLISRVPRPQHFILWVHGNRILNFDTTRGGISVKSDIFDNGVKSSLFIANASPLDSGNYTCSLAGVGETTVAVHVIIGETPAAMQHGTGTLLSSSICTSLFTILFSLWEMR
ncbi:zwei Ig domain protein zig-8-like [Homalodisca vitripennis]|uniref:zwei Ig domain protein zig-8-like n=1 Tax=Homalodisca vitripennis TaxID=197043 RepID=UPI001EEBC408|nr:zwei Ig domain protein zig-8-like [Homalodisca vitripennis]